jgi:beta-lactamase regulating signal transducer with metallopeptidase domain
MPWLIHNLNAVADRWAGLAWAVVWQSTLLIGIAGLFAALLLRRAGPAARFWLWQILAIKLLIMPFWTYAIPIPSTSETTESAQPLAMRIAFPAAEAPATAPTTTNRLADVNPVDPTERPEPATQPRSPSRPSLTWQAILLGGWLIFVTLQIARLTAQRVRLSKLLRSTLPADEQLTRAVDKTARTLNLSRVPRAVLADADGSPLVCGILRPQLVLPRSLPGRLTELQLQHVFAHELAHIRRHDLVWGWFTEFARIVYFFNPAVHWLCYRLRLERELACDQIALAATGQNPAEYAATLVQVATHVSQPALFCASTDGGEEGGAYVCCVAGRVSFPVRRVCRVSRINNRTGKLTHPARRGRLF